VAVEVGDDVGVGGDVAPGSAVAVGLVVAGLVAVGLVVAGLVVADSVAVGALAGEPDGDGVAVARPEVATGSGPGVGFRAGSGVWRPASDGWRWAGRCWAGPTGWTRGDGAAVRFATSVAPPARSAIAQTAPAAAARRRR
jgi:hypothetical protein